MATQAGLSATLSQDQGTSAPPNGACLCAPFRDRRGTFDECVCAWGKLIREMIYLGYGAGPLEASQELADFGGRVNILATQRRREILQERLDVWPATHTIAQFCNAHGITRARYDNLGLKRR